MKRIVSAGSVYRLGERGKRKKRKPLSGKELEQLRQKNLKETIDEILKLIEI
jgi:hypothetical protein